MSIRKIIEVEQGIQLGLSPDRPYAKDIVWRTGSNIAMLSGGVRPAAPQLTFGSKVNSRPITGMSELSVNGVKNAFWGSTQALSRYTEDGATTDVSKGGGYSFNREDLWTFQPWGNAIIATAGDVPQLWPDGGSLFADINLAGAGFSTAKLVAELQGFPLLINTDTSPTDVRWPNGDDPTDWVPTANNVAGGLDVYSMAGPIICTTKLAGGLALFAQNESQFLQYVGPPNFFRSDELLSGIGCVSAHSTVTVGRVIYGFGRDGLWRTDGSEAEYIDEPFFHRELFDNMNQDNINLCHLWHDQAEKMVVLFYPETDETDISRAIGYSYVTNRMVYLDYARTATTDKKIFNNSLLGDQSGNIYSQLFVPAGSDFPFSPPTEAKPLELAATGTLNAPAYGALRYGEGSYGGLWDVTG